MSALSWSPTGVEDPSLAAFRSLLESRSLTAAQRSILIEFVPSSSGVAIGVRDLAELAGLSRSTCDRTIRSLLTSRVIVEVCKARGRRPRVLRLGPVDSWTTPVRMRHSSSDRQRGSASRPRRRRRHEMKHGSSSCSSGRPSVPLAVVETEAPAFVPLVVVEPEAPACVPLVMVETGAPACVPLVVVGPEAPACVPLMVVEPEAPACVPLVVVPACDPAPLADEESAVASRPVLGATHGGATGLRPDRGRLPPHETSSPPSDELLPPLPPAVVQPTAAVAAIGPAGEDQDKPRAPRKNLGPTLRDAWRVAGGTGELGNSIVEDVARLIAAGRYAEADVLESIPAFVALVTDANSGRNGVSQSLWAGGTGAKRWYARLGDLIAAATKRRAKAEAEARAEAHRVVVEALERERRAQREAEADEARKRAKERAAAATVDPLEGYDAAELLARALQHPFFATMWRGVEADRLTESQAQGLALFARSNHIEPRRAAPPKVESHPEPVRTRPAPVDAATREARRLAQLAILAATEE